MADIELNPDEDDTSFVTEVEKYFSGAPSETEIQKIEGDSNGTMSQIDAFDVTSDFGSEQNMENLMKNIEKNDASTNGLRSSTF